MISIFVLLLISVVAIALVVSSGTETAMAGNYRSATGVYYAALSGLEEARGRLLVKNPDAFNTTDPKNFLPAPGIDLKMGDTYYLINPVGGEPITPWDSASTYADNQFVVEFPGSVPTNPSPTAVSVWNRNPLQALKVPGALYKWVRINAVSEKSMKIDADADGKFDSIAPLHYDGVRFSNDPLAGPQVLELTSFAILPNGSQKLVQYLVAPTPVQLPPFQAALTLAGKNSGGSATVGYSAPASNANFWVQGDDHGCDGTAVAGSKFWAIGTFNSTDTDAVINGSIINGVKYTGIPTSVQKNYTGTPTPPSVNTVYSSFLSTGMQTPAGLDAALQPIIQNADVVITPSPSSTAPYLGTATGADLTPLGMNSGNLLTVVVNGNLDISNWSNDGYGLLLVTGTFTYDPDTNWYGIILVIGQGAVNNVEHKQYKQINGAMLVAKTRDSNNQVLPGPDLADSSGVAASVEFDDKMQGYGIRYSSCWVQRAQPTSSYKILSFHEIAQ